MAFADLRGNSVPRAMAAVAHSTNDFVMKSMRIPLKLLMGCNRLQSTHCDPDLILGACRSQRNIIDWAFRWDVTWLPRLRDPLALRHRSSQNEIWTQPRTSLRGVEDGMLQHSRAARRPHDFSHIQCYTAAFFRSAGAGAVATP